MINSLVGESLQKNEGIVPLNIKVDQKMSRYYMHSHLLVPVSTKKISFDETHLGALGKIQYVSEKSIQVASIIAFTK